jgi:hypothetical protein
MNTDGNTELEVKSKVTQTINFKAIGINITCSGAGNVQDSTSPP